MHLPWRLWREYVWGLLLRLLLLQARQPTPGVPLVAFTLKAAKRTHGYNEFDIADRLRQFGWVVPVRVPVLRPGLVHEHLGFSCPLSKGPFLEHCVEIHPPTFRKRLETVSDALPAAHGNKGLCHILFEWCS